MLFLRVQNLFMFSSPLAHLPLPRVFSPPCQSPSIKPNRIFTNLPRLHDPSSSLLLYRRPLFLARFTVPQGQPQAAVHFPNRCHPWRPCVLIEWSNNVQQRPGRMAMEYENRVVSSRLTKSVFSHFYPSPCIFEVAFLCTNLRLAVFS
jgi:hypothetical protein